MRVVRHVPGLDVEYFTIAIDEKPVAEAEENEEEEERADGEASWIPEISQICFFLNGPTPDSFSVYFCLFKHTLQVLQQIGI